MAYICKDCSYRGVSSAASGQCPACGSFHLAVQSARIEADDKTPARWRIALLIVLWTILLVMIAWKLLN